MIYICISVLLIILLYIVAKFVIKPFMWMRKYKNIKGATLEPFFPIFGHLVQYGPNFKKYGQEFWWKKKFARNYPGTKVMVTNILDRPYLLLMSPQLLKQYFSKQHLYIKEPFLISNRIRLSGVGLPVLQGQQWSRRRRIFSNIFNFDFFNNSLPVVQQIIQQKINNVKQEGLIHGRQFSASIAGLAVLKIFFGVDSKQKMQDMEITMFLINLLNQGIKSELSLRFFLFGTKILNMGLFKQDRIINQKFKNFHVWAEEIVKQKLAQQSKQKHILSLLKEKNLIQTKQGLTIHQIVQQFISFFEAGTQTTSFLTSMCFYYLAIYPQYQQALIKEIRNAPQPKSIKEYNQYPFLDAIINETFKHYGYVSSTFIRQAVEDHYLGEFPILKGTLVGPGWYQNNFNPQFFQDVEKFDPYRWMKSESDKQVNKNQEFIFTPFSAGPRNCIGKNFALLEAKAMIWGLISKFNMKLKQGYVHKLWLRTLYSPVNPIYIILQPAK